MSHQQNYIDFKKSLKEYTSGLLSGWIQILITQPFDTTKTRIQTNSKEYNTITQTMMKIWKNEGFLAFFKGMLSPLLLQSFIWSIYLGSYDALKRIAIVSQNEEYNDSTLPNAQIFAIGGLAGCLSDLVHIPMEHIKTRIQIQSGEKKIFSGSINAFYKIFKDHGIKGVYKTTLISFQRDFIGCGFFFIVYENLKRKLLKRKQELQVNQQIYHLQLMGASIVASFFYWLMGYPFDIIRAKLQSDSFKNPQYKGSLHCLKQTLKQKGWILNLYKGFWITQLQGLAYTASGMYGYEICKYFLTF